MIEIYTFSVNHRHHHFPVLLPENLLFNTQMTNVDEWINQMLVSGRAAPSNSSSVFTAQQYLLLATIDNLFPLFSSSSKESRKPRNKAGAGKNTRTEFSTSNLLTDFLFSRRGWEKLESFRLVMAIFDEHLFLDILQWG